MPFFKINPPPPPSKWGGGAISLPRVTLDFCWPPGGISFQNAPFSQGFIRFLQCFCDYMHLPTSPQEKKALPAHRRRKPYQRTAPKVFLLKINSIFLLSTSIYCILYVLIGIPCGIPSNPWKPLGTSGNLWKSGGLGGPLGSVFSQNTPFSPGFIRFLQCFTVFRNVL